MSNENTRPDRNHRTCSHQTPSLDTIFEALSHRYRRYTLYALYRAENGVLTIDQLVTRITQLLHTWKGSKTNQQGQIESELREHHLPKLMIDGIVEFDERSETVRYWRQPSLEEWLEHAEYKEGLQPDC